MNRFTLLLTGLILYVLPIHSQSISISQARAKPIGSVVTVSGIITNGDELGPVRYIQDNSAGMAIYNYNMSLEVTAGDSITVTGTTKDYQTLLELDPVSSWTKHSSGHPLPDPVVLTPSELTEEYESQRVEIHNAVFDMGGEPFGDRGPWDFTAGGESSKIYLNDTDNPVIGKPIPAGPVTIIGINSAYWGAFQVILRSYDDLIQGSSIYFTSPLIADSLDKEGFYISWTTNDSGSTELLYGQTPELELGRLAISGEDTLHGIKISGRTASELIYVRAFSVADGDTAWSKITPFITQSESSGDMKVYFNRSVDHTVSTGTNAISLPQAIDDTLIAYIGRAKQSIDFSIYNYTISGISDITAALNAAHSRGVAVRIVCDFNANDNTSWNNLNPAIGKIASPEDNYEAGIGIMHNKFIVFDALSTDPDVPLVWTGSTNFTSGQVNSDPNNVVIIQDKSLAITYRLEFEEMFGSRGLQPDKTKALFGGQKSNNTPHEFIIGGSRVESYFSPSDGTHSKIVEAINTADHEVYANTMLITKTDIAYAIRDKKYDGVTAKVLINSEGQSMPSGSTTIIETLQSLGGNFRDYDGGGTLHHKTLIVDQGHPDSDPLLLTGCHNWSAAANERNDENTLIIHNAEIANLYYQEFAARFPEGIIIGEVPDAKNDFAQMKQGDTLNYNVLVNDEIPGAVDVSISSGPSNGTAAIAADGLVTYIPDLAFAWFDTVYYKVCNADNNDLCDSARLVIYVTAIKLPKAKDDHEEMDRGDTLMASVLDNDAVPDTGKLSIKVDPAHGTATVSADTMIIYIPAEDYAGEDTLMYEICLGSKPAYCDSALLTVLVQIPAGISTPEEIAGISIYPQPASGELVIRYSGDPIDSRVGIICLKGQRLQEEQMILVQGENLFRIDKNIVTGLYILEISNDSFTRRMKVMIK